MLGDGAGLTVSGVPHRGVSGFGVRSLAEAGVIGREVFDALRDFSSLDPSGLLLLWKALEFSGDGDFLGTRDAPLGMANFEELGLELSMGDAGGKCVIGESTDGFEDEAGDTSGVRAPGDNVGSLFNVEEGFESRLDVGVKEGSFDGIGFFADIWIGVLI